MKANVVVSELMSSRINAESSNTLIFLNAEGTEFSAEGEEKEGIIEVRLSCPCSISERKIEETLEVAGIKKADITLHASGEEKDECLSCIVVAILATFYSNGKGIDIIKELEAPPELKAAVVSSLFGGISVYSLRGKIPALIRYFYPSELLKVVILREPKQFGETSASKAGIYDFVEGLSLIYAGESEEGTRALVNSSISILKNEERSEDLVGLPVFPFSAGKFMLLPSSTSCSSFVMNLSAKASEFIKKRSNVRVTRLSRGATVIVQ